MWQSMTRRLQRRTPLSQLRTAAEAAIQPPGTPDAGESERGLLAQSNDVSLDGPPRRPDGFIRVERMSARTEAPAVATYNVPLPTGDAQPMDTDEAAAGAAAPSGRAASPAAPAAPAAADGAPAAAAGQQPRKMTVSRKEFDQIRVRARFLSHNHAAGMCRVHHPCPCPRNHPHAQVHTCREVSLNNRFPER